MWSVAFSPDSGTLAGAAADGIVRLWDQSTGKMKRSLTGHKGAALCVAFSPDGSTIAAGGIEEITSIYKGKADIRYTKVAEVILWDGKTGEVKGIVKGHHGSIWDVAFSTDGTRLATGSYDTDAKVWDLSVDEK